MEQAERERVAKEKLALTVVKNEVGSPPPPPLPASITGSLISTTPVVPAKVIIKQDTSVGPIANGGFELIPPPPAAPMVVSQPAPGTAAAAVIVKTPLLTGVTTVAMTPVPMAPIVKVKDAAGKVDLKDKEAKVDSKEFKDGQANKGGVGIVVAGAAKIVPPALSKAAKKRQAAKERERLAQEKFKRQRFEQRVANDQKEVLSPRLEPFKERQEAIKRLLVYHTLDVAEPSVLALQECDAAFERLSARMLQAKEHLVSRFQLASLKSGMVRERV